jgi:hypothetical protein
MLRKLIIASALLIPVSAIAQQAPQPQQPKDMIISAEALTLLGQQISETPYRYAAPMLQTLQHGLRPMGEPKQTDAPKPDTSK